MCIANFSTASNSTQIELNQIKINSTTTHNKLVWHNKIGEGLYSNVFIASFKIKEKNIADRFAVKISDKSDKYNEYENKKKFLQEVQALSKMKNCQFIIDIISYYTHNNIPYLLLELGDINLGHLFEIMIKKNIELSYGNINFMLDNLSRAAEAMLKCQIVHDDLSPSNIIYFFNQGVIKISDFNEVVFLVTTKNKIISDIASIVVSAKLRFDHQCLAKIISLCDTCLDTNLSEFTENTNWGSEKLYSIIKKMRSKNPEEYINPKEIYKELTLLEPLPMILE
jgi:serine/threonine protein kinase